ncbi:MAG: MFS transporter [Thermodesulfobacteriota bacterium]
MIDKYFKQNVFGISSVEFIWGLGLPVVIESTFLQLFLKSLGASSFVIGFIPAFFFVGCSVFGLLSSYFTSDMAFKRSAVIWLHVISGVSLLFFGCFLFLFGKIPSIILVFFISYAIFSVCIGMTIPVWLNYAVNMFSESRTVTGFAYMMISQHVARLVSSVLIVKWVEKYSFSLKASSLIFISVGILFALSAVLFLFTREVARDGKKNDRGGRSLIRYTIDSVRDILKNRNFLYFLAGDMDYFVVVTAISFYANYATSFCGIRLSIAAGMFVGFLYTGAILTNICLGTLGYLSLRNKYLLSKGAAVSAMVTMILFQDYWSFFLASFLFGISRGTRSIVFAPSVGRLSGLSDATSYFAVAPLLTLVFATGLPLVFGRFLDHFAFLEGDSYRIVFGASVVLIVGTLYFLLKVDFDLA